MHHAIQQPLDIDFYLASQAKPVHAFVCANVGKYRFNNGDALGIDLATLRRLDLFDHGMGYVLIAQTLGSELAAPAIFFTGAIPSQKLAFMLPGFDESLQSPTIGTNIFIVVGIVVKISKGKLFGLRSITKPTGKSLIPAAEFVVRDISIKLLGATLGYIGDTMVA